MPRFNTSEGKRNIVALRTKRKTTAELVNEQLDHPRRDVYGRDDEDGAVEDYEFDQGGGGSEDEDDTYTSGPARRAGGLASSSIAGTKRARATENEGRLRRRGPLDPSLSEGMYAAAPMNVEAAMDDIFGALDMGDMEAEGEEFISGADDDDEEGDEDFSGDDQGSEEEMSDGEEDDDDEFAHRPQAKGKAARARRAKDLSEEEYAQWLERRQKQRRPNTQALDLTDEQVQATISHGPLAGEEIAILQQLEELRQAQMGLVSGTGAAGEDGEESEAAAEREKAQAEKERAGLQAMTRRYLHLFGQLLRVRVKLQPAVNHAMRMPQHYALPLFLSPQKDAGHPLKEVDNHAEKAELLEQATALRTGAVEVQESLKDILGLLWRVSPVLDGKQLAAPERKRPRLEGKVAEDTSPSTVPDFAAIERYHQHMLGSVKACLDLWGRKLVQTNSAKLTTISQPLTQQVEAILASKTRLLHKVQKNRAHVSIMGHPDHIRTVLQPDNTEVKVKRAMQLAAGDVDEEVFDDGDFLRELVRRGGVLSSRLEQQLRETEQATGPQKGPQRRGFHRLTKGKTVDYEPHPKLVGFVIPQPIEESGRKDVVLQSLFQ